MDFNEYLAEIWHKEHPLAKAFADFDGSVEVDSADNSIEILQKLDWINYCQNHNITIDENFLDELFDIVVSRFVIQASENEIITYGDIADCIDYAPSHKKQEYDEKLISTIENILTHNYDFITTFNLFLSWTSNRFTLLTDVKLGFPPQEMDIMMSFYRDNRNNFIMKRNTDFPAMKVIANYFLRAYECCKTIDTQMISGDLFKFRSFLLCFMRDVLSSSVINGYYEYENKIKQIIEQLKYERAPKPTVFISYQWSEDSAAIADRLQKELEEIATVRRDTINLVTGDSLSDFMKTIRNQDFAILIINDAYLKSRNCMFEMAQLLRGHEKNEKVFWNKVLLFVTAKLYSEKEKAEIIGYWKQKIDENEAQIKSANSESMEVLAREQKEFYYIYMEIGKLLEYATDTLCEKDIDKFIELAKERISKPKV